MVCGGEMELDYPYEKLAKAVELLAGSEATLQTRLELAWCAFEVVTPENYLPPDFQQRFRELNRRMTRRKTKGNEGPVTATLKAATSEELAWFAREIVALFEAIAVAHGRKQQASDPASRLAYSGHPAERRN
jgi:hypothetical protein